MVWIRILVVTPLVLVMGAVVLLSFLALQAVFAGEGRTRPAYAGDSARGRYTELSGPAELDAVGRVVR
jgi:hypothetical protein